MPIPEITFAQPSNYTLAIIALIVAGLLLLFLFYRAGGFREVKKMWCDITINPATGSYSMKRLFAIGAFFNATVISYCAVLKINIHPVVEFGIDRSEPILITGLVIINLAVALGATYQVLLGHLNSRKTADENGQPLEEPYKEVVSEPVVNVPAVPIVETEADPSDADPGGVPLRTANGKFAPKK